MLRGALGTACSLPSIIDNWRDFGAGSRHFAAIRSGQGCGGAHLRRLRQCRAGGGFATNGYGEHSPDGYGLLTEVVLTAVFLIVILGATSRRAVEGASGLAIGLCLTLIHLVSIPVTNTSVNPARSTGLALLRPEYALTELWAFWAAPLAGALLGGALYRVLFGED
jgi:glycerol uptake facilitator-like aquaporin